MPDYLITVRATPRAARDEIAGWKGDVLQVRVRAAPTRGEANEAVCRLVARTLGLPSTSVELATGATARVKRLRVRGLDAAEAARRLGRLT